MLEALGIYHFFSLGGKGGKPVPYLHMDDFVMTVHSQRSYCSLLLDPGLSWEKHNRQVRWNRLITFKKYFFSLNINYPSPEERKAATCKIHNSQIIQAH